MSTNETKELGIFENLNLIPQILEQNQKLLKRVEKLEKELIPELDLTKRANVLKYLKVSNSTLENMMKDGRLKQGIHFIKNLNGNRANIQFIESAIKEYKDKK